MAVAFVGTWTTKWTSFDTGEHEDLTVTVTESFRTDPHGMTLDGMYDAPNSPPGTMHGAVSNGAWTGDWKNAAGEMGGFTLTFHRETGLWDGNYSAVNKAGTKNWSATKLRRRHVDQ